jgi:hypothetical protein
MSKDLFKALRCFMIEFQDLHTYHATNNATAMHFLEAIPGKGEPRCVHMLENARLCQVGELGGGREMGRGRGAGHMRGGREARKEVDGEMDRQKGPRGQAKKGNTTARFGRASRRGIAKLSVHVCPDSAGGPDTLHLCLPCSQPAEVVCYQMLPLSLDEQFISQ